MGRAKRAPGNWRQRFKRGLHDRFLLRFHMFLITAAVLLSGVVTSKVLWAAGLRTLNVRYPVAVVCSYAIFFLLIRIWLAYVSSTNSDDDADTGIGIDAEDIADGLSYVPNLQLGGGGGGGGSSGGGSGGSGGGSSLGDLGDGDGVVLILLGVVLIAVFGSSIYLIWEAPTVLGEAAVQMVLATSLTRATRRIDEPGWAGSVFGATWIPFTIVLVLVGIFATAAMYYCPGATRMHEILHACGGR